MASGEYAVPLAWDNLTNRNVVKPEEAEKHRDYFCPNCTNRIHRRGGPKVTDHFYHLPPNESRICNPESVYHAVSKQLLAKWIEEGKPIRILDDCPRCGAPRQYSLPPGATKMEEQVGVFRGDLVCLDGQGNVGAVIEIRYTHAMGERKMRELAKPWVEFDAMEIFGQQDAKSVVLHALASGQGWPTERCSHCEGMDFLPLWDGRTLKDCPRFPLAMLDFVVRSSDAPYAYAPCRLVGLNKKIPCRFYQSCDVEHVHCTATETTLAIYADEAKTVIEQLRIQYKQQDDRRRAREKQQEEAAHRRKQAERQRRIERKQQQSRDTQRATLEWEAQLRRMKQQGTVRAEPSAPSKSAGVDPEVFVQRLAGAYVLFVRCPLKAQTEAIVSVHVVNCAKCPEHERRDHEAYCGWSHQRIEGFPL